MEKRHFGKTGQTGAVRKGELLRGKVSQGRPHPLSIALRCEGRRCKKKQLAGLLAQRFFFASQSIGMTLSTTSWVVWHAVIGRAEPCRGAFQGFAPAAGPFCLLAH